MIPRREHQPVMNARSQHPVIEWGLVIFLLVLCGILTVLQYHWTGEVSRAEVTRLRSALSEQAQSLVHDFDSELAESCRALLPDGAELDTQGREAAHVARLRQWKSASPRPLFTRIAVVVPAREGLELHALDLPAEKFVALDWPSHWFALKDSLDRRRPEHGGAGPFADPSGALLEFPVFGGGMGISEWLVLELDLDYVRGVWLPELVRAYLDFDNKSLYDVEVKTVAAPLTVLYSSRPDAAANGETPYSIRFHHQGKSGGNPRQRPPYVPVGPDGRAAPEWNLWVLEARPRPGALEAMVSASRRRNFAVAALVNGLILTAGVALVVQTRRSRQLAEAQMNFVANVSHELRTPLTVIRGAAHNIKRGVVQERAQLEQYSGLIIQHTEQLTEIIEQLLELAGARKNQTALTRNRVELAKVLREAIAATKRDAEIAGCAVELSIPTSLPEVSGDAAALRRVFQNLLTNAARHGGTGGWIGITATTVNGVEPMLEVQVVDRGPGIPENEQAEIFKPFVRGSAAQEKQIRGSGLGLSLVKEIVEAHGGAVLVRSQPGQGATFAVRLPAKTATEPT
jgi:signal transduction histidine kinase